jgi:hypothetical protein
MKPRIGSWTEAGFEDFRDGTLGNSGQNLYVSRAGILQRIHHFDMDGNGYADVLFVNSQDNGERPPAHVYEDVLGRRALRELRADGASCATAADLNGDGYDDLVLGMEDNGIRRDLHALVYFGGAGGMSGKRFLELPAPEATSVAAGDFNGDGLVDLAFASRGKLRVFFQTSRGFLPEQPLDLPIEAHHLVAAELDGDGCVDLYVKGNKSGGRVYWGGPEGFAEGRSMAVCGPEARSDTETYFGRPVPDGVVMGPSRLWLPRVVRLLGRPWLFHCDGAVSFLVPVGKDRRPGEAWMLETGRALSVVAGDFDGDGKPDLAFATTGAQSCVLWDVSPGGKPIARTTFPTRSALDLAAGDLDGDGRDELVVAQQRTEELCSTDSQVVRFSRSRQVEASIPLPTHDARACLVARTAASPRPQVIFANRMTGRARGDICSFLYPGGPEGFSEKRRIEFPGWAAADAVCCDFNDDGRADLFFANSSENSPGYDPGSFLFWAGTGGFDPSRWDVLPTTRAIGLACADLDRDGWLDLVVVGFWNDELTIFHGGPKGFEGAKATRIRMVAEGYRGDNPRRPFVADFNRDGWLDLVVPQISERTLILWGGPGGFSMDRSTILNARSCASANVADLDGDGWPDLVLGGHKGLDAHAEYETSVYVYWGGPEGFREDRRSQLPSYKANKVSIADFNRDGVLDLFVNSYHSGRMRDLDAYLYWGAPGGDYSADRVSRLFNHSSCASIAADFNEDGWIDLAVANHKWYGSHEGHSLVWWNGPQGFSEARQVRLPTSGPHGMVSVDPGNLMDRGNEEHYVSHAHELEEAAVLRSVSWEADLPAKTWVRAQVRAADSRESLQQAPWCGFGGAGGWLENGQRMEPSDGRPTGRWLQYRLALGALNSGRTPRVRRVCVEHERA